MASTGSVLRLTGVAITTTFATLGVAIDKARDIDAWAMKNSEEYRALSKDNLLGTNTRKRWNNSLDSLFSKEI